MSDETIEKPMDEKSASDLARSIYADFTVWKKRKSKPKWHPVKKMRYVFFRMIDGITIQDAIKEIGWSGSEFWHLLDLKRNAPFEMEYKRAKKLHARAVSDSIQQIAEGRDKSTKRQLEKQQKIIRKALRRALKQKSSVAARSVVQGLLAQLSEHDGRVIARNKLQIDAAKWLAKASNPAEFGEKTALSLNGGYDDSGEAKPFVVQFVAPDGTVVHPLEALKTRPAEEAEET